jgi:PhzF family phenazine biosynthesis protein
MKITVKIINAFGINGTGGNPAGVVLNADKLTTKAKQSIASKLGISETAFVSASDVADFKLEFFTPTKQIAHCGHATIATFSYLKETGVIKKNNSSKETIDGTRNIYFEGNNAFMEQKAPSYQIPKDHIQNILASLTITPSDIIENIEPTIVNTGNSFLIIRVKNESVLEQLKPDFETIKQLSEQFNLIGYYVFTDNTDDKDIDATTRMFAPLYGIEEESATGMAAGPLSCFLHDNMMAKTNFTIQQGKFMHTPSISLIKVNINKQKNEIVNLFAGGSAYASKQIIVEI